MTTGATAGTDNGAEDTRQEEQPAPPMQAGLSVLPGPPPKRVTPIFRPGGYSLDRAPTSGILMYKSIKRCIYPSLSSLRHEAMWLRNPLDDILSSRAKVAALRVVCASSVPLSGREIARRAHIDPGHASRVLRELAASGVLLSRDMGRVAAYELDHLDSPLAQRVRALFAGEKERYHEIVDELKTTVPGVLSVVLFGSEARGEAKPSSDTDLLIVVERKTEQIDAMISEACLRISERHVLALSWHIADLADLQRWEKAGNPFWREVLADGVRLTGQSLEGLQREWQRGKTA